MGCDQKDSHSEQYVFVLTQLFAAGLREQDTVAIAPVYALNRRNDNDAVTVPLSVIKILDSLVTDAPLFRIDKSSSNDDDVNMLSGMGISPFQLDLEAIFVLFPLLLFYYEDVKKQQYAIRQCLLPTQKETWWSAFKTIGEAVGWAMQADYSSQQRSLGPEHNIYTDATHVQSYPSLHAIRDAFFYGSKSYELAILSTVFFHQEHSVEDKRLPLITGITGGLVGSHIGFNRLPLIWRHFMHSHRDNLNQSSCVSHYPDWSTRFTAMWSGSEVGLAQTINP
ncbi:MAG: hypothetical protein AAGD25_02310 [Cyanobacteria bacterium P01_F01_bin.150]